MNVREGSPFADLEVRQAMNKAIDKLAITENLYQGLAAPFEQIPGQGQEGNVEGYDPYPYDPEAARAILSKIAQPIELFTGPNEELAAEAVAEQLRGYGMNVTTVVLETAALSQRNDEGNFDIMLFSAGYAGGGFIGSYYSNNFECRRLETKQVRTGFCDKELDDRIAVIRNETDNAKRAALVEEVSRDLAEKHAPWVPLFGPSEVWAMQPYVKGFVGSSAGQFFDLWKVTVEK